MNGLHGQSSYFRGLEAEHHKLQADIHKIDLVLEALSTAVEDRQAAVGVLQQLQRGMARHFQQEETGGYLEEAVCRVPRLSERVRVLELQHAPLTAELDGIVATAEAAVTENDWRLVRQRFGRFHKSLAAHEAAEDVVVQTAFSDAIDLEL